MTKHARPLFTSLTTVTKVRRVFRVITASSILLALIDDLDHEMDKDALKTACGSQAQRFSPSKEFDRNPLVYKIFIRYLRDDERYALIIPDGDRTWLR